MLNRRLAYAYGFALAVGLSGSSNAALGPSFPSPDKTPSPAFIRNYQCVQLNRNFLKLRQSLQQEVAVRQPAYAAGMLKAETPWQLGVYMAFSNPAALSNYLASGLPENRIAILLAQDLLLGCTGPKLTVQ